MKVISVGNITLGGTGKTPFVICLARILKEELKKEVSVLIRGYGWDEQAMLKKDLKDIFVLVGENRARSAHKAIRLYGSNTAIMDDGFQHWELFRDLNIVLIDSRNPFGNGYLFPRGILREPKSAVKRADIIVFTKVDRGICDINMLQEELIKISEKAVFLQTLHRPKHLYDIKTKAAYDLQYLKGKRVILISSIGDPKYFEETAKCLDANIIDHLIFPDHYDYRVKDISNVMKVCDERNFDILLTTEKDAVKLNRLRFSFGKYTVLSLVVEMDIIKGRENLIDRLYSLYNS